VIDVRPFLKKYFSQNLHVAEKEYLIRSGDSAIPTKIFPTQATASD